MIEIINKSQFMDRFRDMNRENQFTYDGKVALFEYLEEYEESTETQTELDIIALCCEYTEYESIKEYLKNYTSIHERKEFDDESFIISNY